MSDRAWRRVVIVYFAFLICLAAWSFGTYDWQ